MACIIVLIGLVISILACANGQFALNVVVIGGNEVTNASSVTIRCSYNNVPSSDGILQLSWNRGEQFEMSDQIASYYQPDGKTPAYFDPFAPPAYMMTTDNIGDGESGHSDLTIQSVTLNDDGRYWCNIVFLSNPDTSKGSAEMIVLVPPASLSVMDSDQSYEDTDSAELIQGIGHEFICIARAANPAASLTWTLSGVSNNRDNTLQETPNKNDVNLIDTVSNMTVYASWSDHHNQFLKCEASHSGLSSSLSLSVKMDVKVPPKDIYILDVNQPDGYPQGEPVKVIEGNSHRITCKVLQTRPAATIEWYLDNVKQVDGITTPIPPSNGDNLVNSTGYLTLVPSRVMHKQMLECRASNGIDGAQDPVSRNIVLNVYGPPDEPILGIKENLTEETKEVFNCMATNSFPEGGIEWYNGNKNITDTAAVNELDGTDNRYDISSTVNFTPNRSDNGNTIKCNVTHETLTGSDEKSDSKVINVQFCAHSISISESCPHDVIEGQISNFTCASSSSNPKTDLLWMKGGNSVTDPPVPIHDNGDYGGKKTTLTYSSNYTRGDNGITLECCGTIDFLLCNNCSTCKLNVLYPPVTPTISKNPINSVPEGQTVNLTCVSEGNPDPTFTWMKNDSSQILGSTDTLTLSDITRDQAGYYSCVADNDILPRAKSEEEIVIVHYTPEITNREDDRVSADEGSNAILECISQGNPEPEISWYNQNGTIITNDTRRYSIGETQLGQHAIDGISKKSALTISGVIPTEDYGIFMCNASNYVGQNSMSVSLTGITSPDSPKSVNILKDSSTKESLKVEWKSGYNGGAPQWFIVTYQTENDETLLEYSNTTESEGVDVYTDVVEDLNPGSKYEIGVYSGNRIGSNVENVQKTHGITIPESPAELAIKIIFNTNDGTVTVSGIDDPNTSFTCLKLELQLLADSTWVDWECVTGNVQSKPVPQAARYGGIRGTVCVEDVCGEPSPGDVTVKEPGPNNTLLIVLGTIGALILVAIIIGLAVYLVRTSSTGKAKSGSEELTMTSGANGGFANPTMSTAQESSIPTYAEVNKKRATNGTQENDVYDDVANVHSEKNGAAKSDGKTVNSDGLIYQEVGHFKEHPKNAAPIQTEASTEYAALDFNLMKAGNK